MRKITAIFLAFLMLAVVFLFAASCGEAKTPESTTTTTNVNAATSSTAESTAKSSDGGNDQTETTNGGGTSLITEPTDTTSTDKPIDDLENWDGRTKLPGKENIDFGGKTFLFASAEDTDTGWANADEIWVESLTNDAINDAVFERNQIIGKLYNCTIAVDDGGWANGFDADVASGGGKYIAACNEYLTTAKAFHSGNFYNVLNLDIDFTKSWWDQAYFRDLECNGKLYSLCGDFAYHQMKATWLMFYNKNVYEQNFPDTDIYQLVRDKQWTLDKLIEMSQQATKDNDGDTNITFSEGDHADIIGATSHPHNYRGLYFACGEFFVSHDENGKMVCAIESSGRGSDVIDKIRELTTNDFYVEMGYTNVRKAMENNTALFAFECMGAIQLMADVEGLRLGIIPMPLYNEEQSQYYHYVNNRGSEYGIPITYKNMQEAADFFTLFAAHSQKIVRSIYIDTFKYTYASDEESGEMLDLIFDTRTYDPGYHMELGTSMDSTLSSMLAKGGRNQFTSAVKKYSVNINNNIKDLETKLAAIKDPV